jgi:hypothetical protein
MVRLINSLHILDEDWAIPGHITIMWWTRQPCRRLVLDNGLFDLTWAERKAARPVIGSV